MEEEITSEIANQVNKAVSEFREEASKTDIAPIVKDLKTAFEDQNQKMSTIEDHIQSSTETEKAVFADISRISGALSTMLEMQKGMLDSLKGLNNSFKNASETAGGGGGGISGALMAGGAAGILGAGAATYVSASESPSTVAGDRDYVAPGGGAGFEARAGEGVSAPIIPKGEVADRIRGGLTERFVSEFEGMEEEKAKMLAEAFLLNFDDESGLDPDVVERKPNVHGTRGKGLYQLTNDRRDEFEDIYDDDYSIENQLDFLIKELKTSENPAWKKIQAADTVGEAASIIVDEFLRPAKIHETERMEKYSSDLRTPESFREDSPTEIESEELLQPLTLSWSDELPENISEGSNELTLTDPISGEEFQVNFEVEKVGGSFVTTEPITLAEDTDLEGVSGAAGEPIEVTAEIADQLADQLGASLAADVELTELGLNDFEGLTPEVTPSSVNLEFEDGVAYASTSEKPSETREQPTIQTVSSEAAKSSTPKSMTSDIAKKVYDYYNVA